MLFLSVFVGGLASNNDELVEWICVSLANSLNTFSTVPLCWSSLFLALSIHARFEVIVAFLETCLKVRPATGTKADVMGIAARGQGLQIGRQILPDLHLSRAGSTPIGFSGDAITNGCLTLRAWRSYAPENLELMNRIHAEMLFWVKFDCRNQSKDKAEC